MQPIYNHTQIEEKWQQQWESMSLFQGSAHEQTDKEKLFLLFAFAYPSGSGLHVGHVESKTALDILARFHRMNGKHVFFPVGWDAFGLPAENYAIKTGVPPVKTTKDAIDTFRRQIKRIGISYDWESEIATCHPGYYQWTQWLFLRLYEKGLAYQGIGMVNWCPSCQTVLANEQVVNGECERCGSKVVQKEMKQWFFKLTEYKDELISGLDQVDWPTPTKHHQLHWIGKGEGLSIEFTLSRADNTATDQKLSIWTTYWETVFGVTFLVIAPEKFAELELLSLVPAERKSEVEAYLEAAKHKTEEERRIGEKHKTGVDTGLKVVNPVNGTEVPLFVADYVLSGVGTAIVMGVPAHDDRDFAFARKYNLPIQQVVAFPDEELNNQLKNGEKPHEGNGTLVNSGQFDGLEAWGEGKKQMAEWMIAEGFARWQTTYKLRDWLISRQRYWGAPIPVVYDPEGKPHAVKAEHLPWMLPTDVDFKPTGESPLKSSQEFIERTEKLYGKGWRPEFDTMDTFVDSSWYYLRYVDARNENAFADQAQIEQWLPVDFYMIGPEHIVLHLLYSRFLTKFLRDEGLLQFDEPFMKMRHQGMILGPDGRKMSKSKGNVINPDDIVEKFGADTLRVYEMFMGPIDADKPWEPRAVAGVYRFLTRIYRLFSQVPEAEVSSDQALLIKRKLHQTIEKITSDIPELKFNTSIAAMMELVNAWEKAPAALGTEDRVTIAKLLAPFAPFIAEELYQSLHGTKESIHLEDWPVADKKLVENEFVTIPVQINGKVRHQIEVRTAQVGDKDTVLAQAEAEAKVQSWVSGKTITNKIYVPGKIINLVIKE